MRERNTKERIVDLLGGGQATNVGALASTLGVTTQAVLYHLAALRERGLVRQLGQGRAARWERCFEHRFVWELAHVEAMGGEWAMWTLAKDAMAVDLAEVNEATQGILAYTVSEMLNNAIDHSNGTRVELLATFGANDVELVIADDGIGAFKKVRDHFNLADELEAIAHVAKGQQTTWSERHTGQGLFFSSRAVETFEVESGGRIWKVDNVRDDTTISAGVLRAGTKVTLRTNKNASLTAQDLFDRYSIEEYAFDKGGIRVALSAHGDEFVSRSEAKRLGVGLELYGEVELDFANVRAVGQGFVDELFRVWVEANPGTAITYINASEEVAFMIQRGLPKR